MIITIIIIIMMMIVPEIIICFVFVLFLNVLVNYKVISRTGPKTERLTILCFMRHSWETMTSTN